MYLSVARCYVLRRRKRKRLKDFLLFLFCSKTNEADNFPPTMRLNSSYDQQLWERAGIWGSRASAGLRMFAACIWIHLCGGVPFVLSGCRSECGLLFLEMAKACLPGPSQTAPAHPPSLQRGNFSPSHMPQSMFSVVSHLNWKMLNRFIQEPDSMRSEWVQVTGAYRCVCTSVNAWAMKSIVNSFTL